MIFAGTAPSVAANATKESGLMRIEALARPVFDRSSDVLMTTQPSLAHSARWRCCRTSISALGTRSVKRWVIARRGLLLEGLSCAELPSCEVPMGPPSPPLSEDGAH